MQLWTWQSWYLNPSLSRLKAQIPLITLFCLPVCKNLFFFLNKVFWKENVFQNCAPENLIRIQLESSCIFILIFQRLRSQVEVLRPSPTLQSHIVYPISVYIINQQ